MAAKLDKSLDEILSSEKLQRRRQRRAARAGAGGARKQKAARAAQQAAPAAAAAPVLTGDSKIIVSGLPSDVDEASIKEYFSKSAGPVKKVILTYNQNGTSRGIASIIFRQPESAAKAAKDLNGMLVDKKPIKIEVVVDPTRVQPAAASSAKSLADRASQPKAAQQPAKAAGAAGRRRRPARRGRGAQKLKPKTAEELDQEMTDYFAQSGNGAEGAGAVPDAGVQAQAQAPAPAAQPANGGDDMGMEDI